MATRKTNPSRSAKTRILLVDDHALMRRGLKALIETEPDLVVCAEAATPPEALEAIKSSKPCLVITDLSFHHSDIGGLELINDIKRSFPRLPVLALSMHAESSYAERALRAGARGYVSKQEIDDTVLIAIRRVLAGEIHLSDAMSRKIAQRVLDGGKHRIGSELEILSDRQMDVFRRIGASQTTREIAAALHLSVKTIESHREQLKAKLGVPSGAELTRRATRWVETGHLH